MVCHACQPVLTFIISGKIIIKNKLIANIHSGNLIIQLALSVIDFRTCVYNSDADLLS